MHPQGLGGIDRIADDFAELGERAFVLPCNLSDFDAVAALPKQAIEAMGSLDILVNNAGIQHVARIENFPIERWDAIIAINLSSAFHASRAVLPAMQKANWGRIINVASVHGLVGSAENSAYVAAKHGIVGLTKVTALENAKSGITCNAICPGWVLTPLVQKQVDAKAQTRAHKKEQKNALASLIFLKEKRDSRIKDMTCMNGGP